MVLECAVSYARTGVHIVQLELRVDAARQRFTFQKHVETLYA
jgi:hypothetical protein